MRIPAGMRSEIVYRLVFRILSDGERYPFLLDRRGMPLWYPTLFATTQCRNASRSPNTTRAALSAIRLTLYWADENGIDLPYRFGQRDFLNIIEVESLARSLKSLRAEDGAGDEKLRSRSGKMSSARAMPSSKRQMGISRGETYTRITYAAIYLRWLAQLRVEEEARTVDKHSSSLIEAMMTHLRARRPPKARGSSGPMALSPREEEDFRSLVKSPGKETAYSRMVQQRNLLIVTLLDELGVRAGEFLGLKVADIDFQAQEIVINRRHHDPEDPRLAQPMAKTLDRRLALSNDLAGQLYEYIMHCRAKLKRARHHPYLIVSLRGSRAGNAGDPLSISALEKIIRSISRRMPDGSRHVYAHLFRHGSASKLAAYMHAQGASDADMQESLNYKFGWQDGSPTHEKYTAAFKQEKSLEIQRKMQNSWKSK